MNEKFYRLPKEKQQKIINAGYRIFSRSSYKKSPVGEIAGEAEISKSLLFHYFQNKKELYLFLWEKAALLTVKRLEQAHCYEEGCLFDNMERAMLAKFQLIRQHPNLTNFVVRAFFEKDGEICAAIQQSYQRMFLEKAKKMLKHLDPADYVEGLDLAMMLREIYWASEGYLWEQLQNGGLNLKKMEQDYRRLLAFWRSIYENPNRRAAQAQVTPKQAAQQKTNGGNQ